MKIGDKTYELILPEFQPYEKIYSGCCLLEENIKNGFPFYATIMVYDDSLQGEIVDQEDYFIEITHKVADEDNISQSEYNDMIHELQLAYAKCVFKTLFKEV